MSGGLKDAFPVLATMAAVAVWSTKVKQLVPEPYLDEVFHVPQAQAFWAGKWNHWDDMITTPPGLYYYSLIFAHVIKLKGELTTLVLRESNSVLLAALLAPLLVFRLVAMHPKAAGGMQREFCIVMFPLLFFFSSLYYTDIFATFTAMLTYAAFVRTLRVSKSPYKIASQIVQTLFGLIALQARQTNIFWVAVFPAGIQAIQVLKQAHKIRDPKISEAYLEDYFYLIRDLAVNAFTSIPQLLLDLWPQIFLLVNFATFVYQNGGVVLGDKSNHVATIHIPQMLYIWPFLVFFSWPVLLPLLSSPGQLLKKLPRWWLTITTFVCITAVVHLNTIIHKFMLADNRHYTFYVFKILRNNPALFYLLVPVYAACAWLCLLALDGPCHVNKVSNQQQRIDKDLAMTASTISSRSISFLLVFVVTTALTLITAPLVEPRYFILPWLFWRIHVPDMLVTIKDESPGAQPVKTADTMRSATRMQKSASDHLRLEFSWYALINFVTCYIFLYRGFTWLQEPGKTQRFMW